MMLADDMNILVNGEARSLISVTDRGLQYGDGLFETLAVVDGQCPLWHRHMARLKEGCSRLSIPCPDGELLYTEAQQLIADRRRAVLKIMFTRGEGGRGYRYADTPAASPTRILMCLPWPEYPVENTEKGVRLHVCETRLARQPVLAGLKHLNRLEQVIARNEWRDESVVEGIMLDPDGNVIEGTYSNIFMVNNGRLFTPDLSACGVAGVMRAYIIEQALSMNIPCKITEISLDELFRADEVFICNSLFGIWPVVQIQNHEYAVGALTGTLQQLINDA